MTDALNEQLSALLDGELPVVETELVLKRLERDAQLRARLARYALVGDAMRATAPVTAPRATLAARVGAALDREGARTAPRRRARWLKPLAGLAVAAGVATVSVVLIGRAPVGGAGSGVALNVPPAATRLAAATPARPVAAAREPASYVTPAMNPTLQDIPPAALANYVVAHSEYSSLLGRHAVLTELITEPAMPEAKAPAPVPPFVLQPAFGAFAR